MTARAYVLTMILCAAALLIAVGGFTAWIDPYWLFRADPPWAHDGKGENISLDRRLRYAKALQVVARQPETVILGTSRVYRGFDTEQLPGGVYNLGISGLRIAEAEGYVRHLTHISSVKRLILGLDLSSFDARQRFEAGYDPALGRPTFVIESGLTSLFSKMAVSDAYETLHTIKGGGEWTRSGFKHTPVIDGAEIAAIHRRLVDQGYRAMSVTDWTYEALQRLLAEAQKSGMEVTLFLTPMHRSHLDAIMATPTLDLDGWRQRVRAIADEVGVRMIDLSVDHPYLDEDLSAGSTEYWLDSTHFSPKVGAWVLRRLQP